MKFKHLALGTAAATVAAMAVAGPALATGSAYKVSVGGSSAAGTHNVTATAGAISFAVPLVTMSCTSANVPASPVSTVASGPSGIVDIASINKVNFVGCTGPGGALTVTTSGSWKLHGTSVATSGSTDIITGHVENITAQVTNAACDFTVKGTAKATFNEATQVLNVSDPGGTGGLLKVTAVNPAKPCLSKVKVNDIASFGGAFTVSSAGGILVG